MMKYSEADHALVLRLAKDLGITLDEWQEWLLLELFHQHRQKPAGDITSVDPGPGMLTP